MNIKKSSWILLGIFLWGIPTAIFLSLLLAVKKPGTLLEAQDFQQSIFLKSLYFTVPIFSIMGTFYGLWMDNQTKK
jgi:hypothetical protein